MVQPTHRPDAVLTLRVSPALRARFAELLARVPDAGAARLSRHGLAVWCLERGLLEAEADPDVVLRAPARAPSKPSVSALAETSPTKTSSSPTLAAPNPSREKRSKITETLPRPMITVSPSGDGGDALRARWRALVAVQGKGAKAAGVSQPWVSRWLAGEKTGSPELLARIAAYLDSLAPPSTG